MRKSIKIISSTALSFVLAAFVGVKNTFAAESINFSAILDSLRPENLPANLFGPEGVFTNISNIILIAIAAISAIMLIIGGIRYATSGGDNKKVTDAKNTILYAIIGLVIAILAYAIVNFVLNALGVSTEATN